MLSTSLLYIQPPLHLLLRFSPDKQVSLVPSAVTQVGYGYSFSSGNGALACLHCRKNTSQYAIIYIYKRPVFWDTSRPFSAFNILVLEQGRSGEVRSVKASS